MGDWKMEIPIQLTLDLQTTESTEAEASIDYEDFPKDAANELARLESFNKHLYRPNTYLHKWWARRSGTTFRHILKQLVPNPAKRAFYEPGGLEGQVILDPMMGGGTTLHEAIRMGANVIGIDIDPIPVVQAKATLTLSPLAHKKSIFGTFFNILRENLSFLYQTSCPSCNSDAEIQFTLYGLRRRCTCREVLFVDNFLLRENQGHNIYICPRCQQVYAGPDHSCQSPQTHVVEKGTQKCADCGTEFVDILDEPFSERYVPLVISGMCPEHGYFFKAVTERDLATIDQARTLAQNINFGDPRGFRVPNGPKSDDLLRREVTSFQELFTPRQLLYLSTSWELLSQVSRDDRAWLSLLLSTSLEFNSLLCGYKGAGIRRPGAIRHVFSHHAYSFPYTALENNPVFSEKRSGTLKRLFYSRIVKASRWAVNPVERYITDEKPQKVHLRGEIDGGQSVSKWEELGEGTRKFLVLQGDAASLDIPEEIADYVVTDPPYYDSVQYSDLSNFFRVWLRLFLPQEADWGYDPLASAVSEGDEWGDRKYGEVLGAIWQTCHQALNKKHGRLIFTFHHWNPKAWAELTLSLKRANFALDDRHVVFSENPISVHIRTLKALKHDVILILQPETRKSLREWPKLEQIDASDSYTFCRDCGTTLGWFLTADLGENEIRSQWQQLMNGDTDGNGETPS
jgi:putative DNA methylase